MSNEDELETILIENYAEPELGQQLGPQLLNVHPISKCDGRACCIHNPSDHHMVTWSMNWRADRYLMERICPNHGVGHPDPDDLAWKRSVLGEAQFKARAEDVHGCCGCCRPPTDLNVSMS